MAVSGLSNAVAVAAGGQRHLRPARRRHRPVLGLQRLGPVGGRHDDGAPYPGGRLRPDRRRRHLRRRRPHLRPARRRHRPVLGRNHYGELGDGTNTGPEMCYSYPCSTTPVAVSGLTQRRRHRRRERPHLRPARRRHRPVLGLKLLRPLGDGTRTDRYTPVAVSGLTQRRRHRRREQPHLRGAQRRHRQVLGLQRRGPVGGRHDDAAPYPGGRLRPEQRRRHRWRGVSYLRRARRRHRRCWGYNESASWGTAPAGCAAPICSTTPVAVSGLTNAVAIAAGDDHTCALLGDGTARCWGDNYFGQLGDDTTTDR